MILRGAPIKKDTLYLSIPKYRIISDIFRTFLRGPPTWSGLYFDFLSPHFSEYFELREGRVGTEVVLAVVVLWVVVLREVVLGVVL